VGQWGRLTRAPSRWSGTGSSAKRVESIAEDQGIGTLGLFAIEKRISQHFMVDISIPVYEGNGANSLFNGSGSPVDVPSVPVKSLTLAGYHSMALYRYMRNLCIVVNGGDVCGWFAAYNQWGKYGWGVNCQTLQPDFTNGGCTLLSYQFVSQYAFSVEVLHLTSQLPTVTGPKVSTIGATGGPNVDHGVRAPSTLLRKLPKIALGAYYVHNVTVADAPGDFGQLINSTAKAYGLYPPLLLAVLRTECGFYTHSFTCDRYGIPPDVSFGWCQVTVQTAAQFGVGNFNVEAVRQYDNNIRHCVVMAARVLSSYSAYEQRVGCDLPPPNLYVAWNAGEAQPCWFLLNPGGTQAGGNFGNFLIWYAEALSQASAVNPYKRVAPRFDLAQWSSYTRAHHLAVISYTYRGALSWAALIWSLHERKCGGVRHRDIWHSKGRYSSTSFTYCTIFTWPRFHSSKIATR
jgi:hypothetical protein